MVTPVRQRTRCHEKLPCCCPRKPRRDKRQLCCIAGPAAVTPIHGPGQPHSIESNPAQRLACEATNLKLAARRATLICVLRRLKYPVVAGVTLIPPSRRSWKRKADGCPLPNEPGVLLLPPVTRRTAMNSRSQEGWSTPLQGTAVDCSPSASQVAVPAGGGAAP